MRMVILAASLMIATVGGAVAQSRRPTAESALPPTAADGAWRGRSDAGSCNQPMDVNLTIEGGLVEGTGKESAGKTALLWSYHGRTKSNGTIELLGHASAFPPQHATQSRLTGKVETARILLSESGGCGRSMTLSR